MRTMSVRKGIFSVVALVAASQMVTGCAATRARHFEAPVQSGFLGDYSQLKENPDYPAALVYIAQGVQWSRYNSIQLESAGLWFGSAGSLLMIYAGLLAAHRKVPSWWFLGARKTWLRGHVWLGLLSVVLSWTIVHTVYALRYARAYYSEPNGGIEFNEEEPPTYTDFAYFAFTVGMTFQVADTNITSKAVRRITLHHALLSYLFGAVLLGLVINVVSTLLK